MQKAKFKIGDQFFHEKQKLFVVVDDVSFFQNKGHLYTLKCFTHENTEAKPWKRYYESKIMSELVPLRPSDAVRVLYGNT